MREPTSLAAAVIDALSSKWPELRFCQGEPGTITLLRAANEDEVAIMSLAPLEERMAAGQSIDDWLKDPQVNRMLDMFAERVTLPEATPDTLVLRLSVAERFSHLDKIPIHRELFDGVWEMMCAHWDEYGARYLNEDDLGKMGLGPEQAWERASSNTNEALRGTKFQSFADQEGDIALIVIEHPHASAALRMEPIRRLLIKHLREPFLACIPAADEVIAMPCQPRSRADGYLVRARQSFLKSSHPVSDRALVVKADGFAPE